MPFFSIVIPTLNEEKYLPKLLEDLSQQTEKNFEVVVVDGGSKDGTIKKAGEFVNKLSLTIIKSPKANVSFQRNLGAKKAKGKWLIFFDADVEIPQSFFKQLYKQTRNISADVLTTYINADSHEVYDQAIARLTNLATEICLMIERPFILGHDFMVKKAVFVKSGGFDPKIKFAEDYELAERLYKAGHKIIILKHPRTVYSLRRLRYEGRLKTLRKSARAGLHILTKGHITRELFEYKMGGGWYKLKAKSQIRPQVLARAEKYVRKFIKLFIE